LNNKRQITAFSRKNDVYNPRRKTHFPQDISQSGTTAFSTGTLFYQGTGGWPL